MNQVFVVEKVIVDPNPETNNDRIELQGIYSSFDVVKRNYSNHFSWHQDGYWRTEETIIRGVLMYLTVTIWEVQQ